MRITQSYTEITFPLQPPIPLLFAINSYTITATAGTGGTVTGSGSYNYGATATLTATPNTGYSFVKMER